MTLGLTLFTIGSGLIPAVANALIGALEAPRGPLWVWLAFGELPAATTFVGGTLVLGAVLAHVLTEFRSGGPRTGAEYPILDRLRQPQRRAERTSCSARTSTTR